MIKYIKGDLLSCPANIIAHITNCQNVMRSGIALQIAKKYPEAVDADNKTIKGDINKLGTISIARTKDKKIIFNIYAQNLYGRQERQINYEAFYTGICAVRDKVTSLSNNLSLGLFRFYQ